jgi:hypothetical protein
MNVLFINTLYQPSYEEQVRLENIQREISGWRADLHREWHLKRFTPGEKYLSWLNFHNGVRRHWKIYITNNSSLQDEPPDIA